MYKSYMNDVNLRKLIEVLLGRNINEKIKDQVISDIIDCATVGNLDNKTLNNIIYKWKEKVK